MLGRCVVGFVLVLLVVCVAAGSAARGASISQTGAGHAARAGSAATELLSPAPWGRGDVLVGGDSGGTVNEYDPSGQLIGQLATGAQHQVSGLCFDRFGDLFTANSSDSTVSKFGSGGNLLDAVWATKYGGGGLETCVPDGSGNVYTGENVVVNTGGYDIEKFDANGYPITTYAADLADWGGTAGVHWMDLASDGCTVVYTNQGPNVKRFDVCTNTQLPDLKDNLAQQCWGVKILADGEVMVACGYKVVRLSSAGVVEQEYDASTYGETNFLALALDPDGTSFWVTDDTSWDVLKIDLASGAQLMKFNDPDGADSLAVYVGAGGVLAPPPPESTYGPCQNPRYATTVRVQEACAQMAADPVDLATGAVTSSATDASMPSAGEPFAFRRSYTSLDTTSGELGVGWTDSYADALTFGNGTVTWRSGSGAQIVFTQQADGTYQAPPYAMVTLSATGGGYEVVTAQQTHYIFDGQGRLTGVQDRNGVGVILAYDANGYRSSLTDSAGRVVTFEHDASGLLTRMALPDGREVHYGYTNGYLTSVTDLRGNPSSYGYDSQGRLATEVDQNNHTVVTNTYGSDGRISEQEDADGNITHFAWDPQTSIATVTDARGHDWTYSFDGTLLVSKTNPYGARVSYGYDPNTSDLTAYQDALGYVEQMSYDSRHNMLSRTAPASLSTEHWTYNDFNEPLSYTDGRGNETDYGYDAVGSLTSVTKPGNVVTSYTRDPATGLVATVTDPRGKVTTYGYDPTTHDLTSITTPLGEKTTFAYDATGRLASSVEPRGNLAGVNPSDYTTTYAYDGADHLTKVTSPDPDGSGPEQTLVRQWEYDPAGNLESTTDPRGNSTLYGYDNANHLTLVSAPDPGTGRPVTQYGYDEVGNLISRIDPNNHQTTYAYDDANRLIGVTKPLSRTWTYEYDANGNRTKQTDPKGGVTTYGYDHLGRLTSTNYSDGNGVTFAYDANGNVTQATGGFYYNGQGAETYAYDALNRLTSVTRGPVTFSYVYDPAGNVTQTTYPDTTVITRTYDDDERLATVSSGGQTTSYGYDPAGNLTTTTLPSGNGYVETRSYDRAGRLTGLTNKKGTSTLSAFALTLDADGNPTTTVRTGANPETDTYAYDSLDRLASVCFQTSCPGQSDPCIRWTYDAVGNRLTETRPSGTTNYTYDTADEMTQAGPTTYTYDANGNETSAGATTYGYNVANQLTSTTTGSTTTTYEYDAFGKRMHASTGSQTSKNTYYWWDINNPLPQLALEQDGSATLIRRYLYGNTRISMSTGSANYYYHYDPLGSVVNLTSSTGATEWTDSYEPFGAVHSETMNDRKAPTNPLKFAGGYLDPTGLYHLGARQYDPSSGRFTSTDPKPTTPTQPYMSAYAYANDDPSALTDPSGLGAIGNRCGSLLCFVNHEADGLACAVTKHPGLVAAGSLGVIIATGGAAMFVGGIVVWSSEAGEGLSLAASLGYGEGGRMMIAGGSVLGGGGAGLAGVAYSSAGSGC